MKKHKQQTLHLNLHRKWFDLIKSGEKVEEYRALSEYWTKRLTYEIFGVSEKDKFPFKKFDTITFSNGYAKDRDQFVIKLIDIEINEGRPDWGAEAGVQYFVLVLGEIVNG